MPDWAQQALAAVVAAIIPIVVKLLNDWHERLGGKAPAAPEPPAEGIGPPEMHPIP